MRELRVDINNKIATYNTRSGVIVCGNTNYKIKFTFDEEWDEFEYKTARFAWNDKYIDVVFYGDSVAVPMLSQATMLTVGVFAGENLHTTTPAKIPCMLSILCVSDRAKEAEYYEVDGTLEYRLPAIRPEDHSKILQAVNGKYELREAPDLTMNEGMVSAALETKVKPVQDKVKELETEIDEVKSNFGGEALRGELNKLYALIVGNAWLLNETFDDEIFESNLEYTLNFASNGQHFAKIEFSKTTNAQGIDTHTIHYRDADGNRTRVYTTAKTNCWEDEAYRNIVTEDAVSLDRVATRVKEEEETDAITLVGAINELGDKVETNQTAIERLNKLPAIIFETEEDIAELAKKFNLDTVTIVGAIDKLATTTNNLNKQYEGIKEDMDAICIPFEFKKFGAEIEFGGLYINIDTLKVWIKIAGYKYTISDWQQVQDIIKWIDDTGKDIVTWVNETGEGIVTWVNETGEVAVAWIDDTGKVVAKWVDETGKVVAEWVDDTGKVVAEWVDDTGKEVAGWVNGVGETIKDVINTICKALWLPEPFPENEEPNKESAEMAGQLIAGAVEAQKKVVSPAWKLNDTFADTNIFDYEFDFTSNGKTFSKMRSQINTGDNGLKTYVIHYIWYENGVERPTTVYSSAKTGGWIDTAYQTVYACNPSASSTAILNNVAGASWRLNEKLKANSLDSFRINCDFIANNEHYVQIRVVRAEGVYSPDDFQYQYDRDEIEFCKSKDEHIGGTLVYYYHPQLNEGGWLNPISGEYDNPTSLYRNITVLTQTDHIAYQLRKIGVEVTEKLDTTAQTMAGGLNEINRYMGNLSELEVKEFTPYSMRRSVEEEAPEQDTLVKAINRVYRRTVAMQETLDELDEKVGESVDTSNLQSKTDETLETNSKEIVGAINESFRKSKQVADIVIPKVIVTDLKDTTWRFNNTMSGFVMARNIKFISNGVTYTQMQAMGDLNSGEYAISYDTTKVYLASTGWIDEAYQNVTYIEGTQLTYSNFINWNNNNGELIKDITLDTEAQTLVEAINELNSKVGGGSSKAITDVTELPTENINPNSIYRLPVGTFYFGIDKMPWICRIVETLPSEGEPATSDMESFVLYYENSTNSASGYVDTMLGEMLGVPSGWYPVEALASLLGVTYSGVVFSEQDIPNDSLSLLIVYKLYQYTNDWLCINDNVGSVGSGYGAEVFNTPRNIASGDYSHAEGYLTEATHHYAHAEGNGCAASGMSSHAEGEMTAAFGHYSHSEGQETIAHGNWQHVQGKYNVQDIDERYAHIVGNGEAGNRRSNAHTIDWQGNAWFSGKIYTGGTGQDDEEAKELATKEYVDSKGGGSAENAALMVTVSTDYPTTMSAIVTAIQEAGGDISKLTFVTLTGYISCNLAMSFAWRGGNYYRVECIDLDTLTRIYNAPTDNSVYDATSMRIGEFLDAGRPEEKEEMPQIRFTTANGNDRENSTFYVNEDSPLKLTVEIVGGGALQVGDQLQVCKQKRFDGCRANNFRRKYKLQRFEEYVVTEEDLNKRFLTVNIFHTNKKTEHGLFRDGKEASLSPLYLRIRRAKGAIQNNDSGQTVDATFSNIVTVWKSHHRSNQAIRIY